MKKHIITLLFLSTFAGVMAQSGTNTNKSACTPRNKYSLGISAFCSFVGVSLKCQLKEHLYLWCHNAGVYNQGITGLTEKSNSTQPKLQLKPIPT